MSEDQTVSSSSTKGKGPAIAGPATQTPPHNRDEVFVLASKIEALLQGQSNKTVLKVLNAVGSQHGVRCIRVERPIGQSVVGTTRAVPITKGKKGQSTPPAQWKQSAEFKELSILRDKIVATIKSLPPSDSSIEEHVGHLREVEAELRSLKGLRSGDH